MYIIRPVEEDPWYATDSESFGGHPKATRALIFHLSIHPKVSQLGQYAKYTPMALDNDSGSK